MDPKDVPKMDILVSDDNLQEDAKKIIQFVKPEWNLETLKFKVFTEGITNKLMGCYQPGDFDNLILVRVNGHGSELTVNRAGEVETVCTLHAAGCAPLIYCTFQNGMAYGFFPGTPLDEKSVREPHIQRLIAEEMVRLHEVHLLSAQKLKNGKLCSLYAQRMQTWLDSGPTHFDNPEKQKVFETEIPSKAELKKELDALVEALEALNMDVVFSHNDLLLKNIVYNEKEDTIRFIDYEYAFYNYEAFDIGNHFCEYAGMDEIDYSLYPEKEEQLPWLRHYLEAKMRKAKAAGLAEDTVEVTDRDVERLYVQVNKCSLASHFLWALWALIQAAHSAIDFDYVQYSSIRLKEYFRRKDEFLKLQLPS